MVANAAALQTYYPWAAFVVGMLGALSYLIMAWIVSKTHLDDPTEFFAIFGGGGIGGVFVAAFFNRTNGIFYENATEGEILVYQVLGLGILIAWTFFIAFITFGLLSALRILRISVKTEIVGYDYIDAARHLDYDEKTTIRTLGKGK